MAIITKGEFSVLAQAKAGVRGKRAFVNESRMFSRSNYTTSIFLSHSHLDKNELEDGIAFLRTIGVSVYVDWMDESMPERPNGVTAQNIKSKIIQNEKFVFLATNNAVVSKWCNWEVGYGDTHKYHKDCIALLPLADNNQTWLGNEYLSIYPRIEKSVYLPDTYWVIYPNGNQELLENWLKK